MSPTGTTRSFLLIIFHNVCFLIINDQDINCIQY
jgi:hypothetical protein